MPTFDQIIYEFITIFISISGTNFETLAQLGSQVEGFSGKLIGPAKVISFIISVPLFIALIGLMKKIRDLNSNSYRQQQSSAGELPSESLLPEGAELKIKEGAMQSRWNEIVKHINSTRETEWRLAIIEADKLIDLVLKRAGFPGETLGERLMNIKEGSLETLQGLWEAHKLRNTIAHDMDYLLRYGEARKALELYEASLKELQAI